MLVLFSVSRVSLKNVKNTSILIGFFNNKPPIPNQNNLYELNTSNLDSKKGGDFAVTKVCPH
jgi:hypothetical protein